MAFTQELTYLEYIEWHKNHKSRYRQSSDENWNGGTKGLEDTYELASKGWDAGVKMLKSKDTININGTTHYENGVSGSIVNIGNYIMGLPETMINIVDETDRNKEPMTVYVDLAYNAGFSKRQAMDHCMKVINIVNELNTKYDLELIGVFSLRCKTIANLFIKIKDMDNRFVLNSIAFAFHPSFFRRMWHDYMNSVSEIETRGSGGVLRDKSEVMYVVKKYSQDKNIHNYIYVPSLQHEEDIMEFKYGKSRKYEGSN